MSDEVRVVEREGKFFCLCGWAIPSINIGFMSPYAGRYRLTIHCPQCDRVWDGDSADSKTIYEHHADSAAHN